MPHEPTPADSIAAALSKLRGRRISRPPWEGADAHGHPHAPHRHGDAPWARGAQHHGHGGPPWGGGPRIGGPARMRLLEALAAASHPLSVGEIAEAVGVDQPRASRLVQQAFQLGLVRREADPDDARRTRVALTDAGAALGRGFRGERREAIWRQALGVYPGYTAYARRAAHRDIVVWVLEPVAG